MVHVMVPAPVVEVQVAAKGSNLARSRPLILPYDPSNPVVHHSSLQHRTKHPSSFLPLFTFHSEPRIYITALVISNLRPAILFGDCVIVAWIFSLITSSSLPISFWLAPSLSSFGLLRHDDLVQRGESKGPTKRTSIYPKTSTVRPLPVYGRLCARLFDFQKPRPIGRTLLVNPFLLGSRKASQA